MTDRSALWGVREVAEFLGVPVSTLYQSPRLWATRAPGRTLRPRDVHAWFEAQDDGTTPAR
jgi:hypothetical protein